MKMKKILGTRQVGADHYEYVLFNDRYVYTLKNGKSIGWLCSEPAWDRTIHKILS